MVRYGNEAMVAEQKTPAWHEAQQGQLEAIREIVLGPPMREVEMRQQKLSQQIEQLVVQQQELRLAYDQKLAEIQADYDERLERYARRLVRHRSRVKRKLEELETELQRMRRRARAERNNRIKLAELLEGWAQQLRSVSSSRTTAQSNPNSSKSTKSRSSKRRAVKTASAGKGNDHKSP